MDESRLERELKKLALKLDKSDTIWRWILTQENKNSWSIKRNIKKASTGKKSWQRLPKSLYRDLSHSELERLIRRLNYETDSAREQQAKERFEIHSAFISSAELSNFLDQMRSEIPTQEVAEQNYSRLKKHFIDFFMQYSANPSDWHRKYESQWAKYLEDTGLAVASLRTIIQVANRFMRYLYKRRRDELYLIKFEPISRARFKMISAEQADSKSDRLPKYIKPEDHETILKNIPDELRSYYLLSYKFGIRRGEALGLYGRTECVKMECLEISLQGTKLKDDKSGPSLSPTKGRSKRDVPYWYSTPDETYELIEKMILVSPDEITRRFSAFCKSLKMGYHFHDTRHTFITNAVNDSRRFPLNDVRIACGHFDISVTNGYLRDSTAYDKKKFIPSHVKEENEKRKANLKVVG